MKNKDFVSLLETLDNCHHRWFDVIEEDGTVSRACLIFEETPLLPDGYYVYFHPDSYTDDPEPMGMLTKSSVNALIANLKQNATTSWLMDHYIDRYEGDVVDDYVYSVSFSKHQVVFRMDSWNYAFAEHELPNLQEFLNELLLNQLIS